MRPGTLMRCSVLVLALGLATAWNALAQLPPSGKLLTFIVPQPTGNPTDGMLLSPSAHLDNDQVLISTLVLLYVCGATAV